MLVSGLLERADQFRPDAQSDTAVRAVRFTGQIREMGKQRIVFDKPGLVIKMPQAAILQAFRLPDFDWEARFLCRTHRVVLV